MRLSQIVWPAAAAILFGTLALVDASAAADQARRLAAVLGFAAGMSATVNLAAGAGVFSYLAAVIEKTSYTWACFIGLCIGVTVFFSLDTTAIMLTPLAVELARRLHLNPLVFALPVIWIANLASLALPVSNLTNLLSLRFFAGPYDFISQAGLPALAGIVVALAASAAARFAWRAPASPAREQPPSTPPAPVAALAILAITLVALLTPLPFWLTATLSALAMAATVGVDKRRHLIPWQALALVVAVTSAASLLPTPSLVNTLHPALTGAIAANLMNNLPAYLVMESAMRSSADITALLVGVNFGPLVTPWASLATLLWHDQLKRIGVSTPWRAFIFGGAIIAPCAVALGSIAIG